MATRSDWVTLRGVIRSVAAITGACNKGPALQAVNGFACRYRRRYVVFWESGDLYWCYLLLFLCAPGDPGTSL